MKSVLTDFLVSAGIKPTCIVSYNHLGNNDGKNLSAPQQFRSKEISKSNVVDDMVNSNRYAVLPKFFHHYLTGTAEASAVFLAKKVTYSRCGTESCSRRASTPITASLSSKFCPCHISAAPHQQSLIHPFS
jgi:hypothetical protein